jgi:glutamate N-acetyltransferase/amino-acid N-acetyltransferase
MVSLHPQVAGFRFSGVECGIKKRGGLDLGLVVADAPAVVAGMFTRNVVRAAPLVICERRVAAQRTVRAILVNSGNANACTGEPGRNAALASCQALARELGITDDEVLPASTGVVGQLLQTEKITAALPRLVQGLEDDATGFAHAIITTDRWAKIEVQAVEGARVVGIAKGAGMIHPDVGPPQATMLAFLFTDARIGPLPLQAMLAEACQHSFNICSVDGDTSTNDTVLALASGRSEAVANEDDLGLAISSVCHRLAQSMVLDGEGAEHAATIDVRGLKNDSDARVVARTIATSMLVKTAMAGCDSNWGRVLAAAGRSGVEFDPGQAAIAIGGVSIVSQGLPVGSEAEARANEVMKGQVYRIEVVLGSGAGQASYMTSDLGHGYVDVNAGYRS